MRYSCAEKNLEEEFENPLIYVFRLPPFGIFKRFFYIIWHCLRTITISVVVINKICIYIVFVVLMVYIYGTFVYRNCQNQRDIKPWLRNKVLRHTYIESSPLTDIIYDSLITSTVMSSYLYINWRLNIPKGGNLKT
jgi:hypothetical protein